ncbi:helix-turn-helix domain-containing protein [Staphylococcus hominis]|uniref:helix-turn-helix domain-containing protein n=1 Tax=Staphylococcus hominis TaxID=1290 RepID=UPI000D1F5CE1|nr:helix-turn-helix transcriptional regulator [Staphylococcus hominis]PTK22516.1 XRE family transcriptional regulator [Staphylococcus hominis]PTK25087.1 XRE family transcriptional regulator [Staphylococcus hominis]RIO53078.1 XRE family transcriptional regulator [Staphylococcus hominis]
MTFGENLKAIRKRMKLTQREMADKMDIARPYLSLLENGKSSISIQTVLYISQQLNISVNKLINDDIELDNQTYNKKTYKL